MKAWTVLATIVVMSTLAVAPISVASAENEGVVVAEGFNSPQGVLVDADGNLYVIDAGVGGDTKIEIPNPETGEIETATMGDTARVVRVAADGKQEVLATLPSVAAGEESFGGSRLAMLNEALYATSGGWEPVFGDERQPMMAAIVAIQDGAATEIAETWSTEKSQNPDGHVLESHPYGLTAAQDGQLWVADAGANTLLKIDPATGKVSIVAVFQGVLSPMPNPNRGGAMESDPVPTAIAFDPAGDVYVSFLPGFPFLPGAAKVVRVAPDGTTTDFATGLTMITDLRTGPDGNLYAVQMGQFTQDGPVPNTGSIIRVKAGSSSEIVVSGLSFPTSLDFNAAGDAFVAVNGVGAPGTGGVLKFAGLTGMVGTPMPAPAPMPTEANSSSEG